jgi:FMN phosphatase YigB (HAD superfamily)
MNIPVWCLSNDVGRWARKLQKIFSIEKLLADSVISSEVQIRKPNCAIYQYLLDHSGFSPNEILFVDDRKKNVDTAIAMGIPSIQFSFDLGYDGIKKKYLLVPPDQDEYNNLPDIV